MAKFEDYTAATSLSNSDIFLVGGDSGTRKITTPNAAIALSGSYGWLGHRNAIPRKKNLGSSPTSFKSAIQAGTFDGLYVGDYWTSVGGKYTLDIVDINYYMNCGDTNFAKPHIVCRVRGCGTSYMNSTNTTEGGPYNSYMYKTKLPEILTELETALGSMVLSHKVPCINAMSNGVPSGSAWYDTKIKLMNEAQVYGTRYYGVACTGAIVPTTWTTEKTQFALFRMDPTSINIRSTYWLEDPVSASNFASVNGYGNANCNYASIVCEVCPIIVLG